MPDGLQTARHFLWRTPSRGRLLVVAAKFFIAFETLVTRLAACALSVKAYGFASSPKGRAKSTAGSVLVIPNTLVMNFTAWLSLRGKTSPAPGEDVTVGDKRGNLARERLRGRGWGQLPRRACGIKTVWKTTVCVRFPHRVFLPGGLWKTARGKIPVWRKANP